MPSMGKSLMMKMMMMQKSESQSEKGNQNAIDLSSGLECLAIVP